MFAGGGHSVRINLISTDGSHGSVTIEDGVVDQCRFGTLLGEDAFYALCGIAGRFMVTRTDPERHRRATVRRGWQELLMEAARLEDEASRPDHEALARPPSVAPLVSTPSSPHATPSRPALRVVEDWFPTENVSAVSKPQLTVAAKLDGAAMRVQDLVPDSVAPPVVQPPVVEPEPMEPEVSEPSDDDIFADLFTEATKAYLLRNLDEAERMFEKCAEMRPGDLRVRSNLKRLIEKRKVKEKG